MKSIQNKSLALSVDGRGRLVSLKNKVTGTELIAHRDVAEAWRLVVPSGRHTLDFLYGSGQTPAAIEVTKSAAGSVLTVAYEELHTGREVLPIAARFSFELKADEPVVFARVEIDNRSDRRIDEVEFPVIGGLGGFRAAGGGREIQLMYIEKYLRYGRFLGDLLNRPLPETGCESDQYVREHETAMWEDSRQGRSGFDFYGATEGLYLGYNTETPQDFALKVERYPKGVPHGPAHDYPKGTPKWLRLWGVHLPQLAAGARWKSEPVTLHVHAGDWHVPARWYVRDCMPASDYAQPPAWMDSFVGWTEITGQLYTGEVFHDFATCARKVIADAKVTGLDLLFYYGHTRLGAEGADYDQAPAAALGGEEGFAAMVRALHAHGIRIMLLDHFHRYINRDLPEYRERNLERIAMLDPHGKPIESRWWKETVLSCRRFEGPTPVWVEICPTCPEWQEYYVDQIRKLVARGVDGIELDCFWPGVCHSPHHGHAPGADMVRPKIEFMWRVRAEIKRLNPDFLWVYETMYPASRETADAWYPFRYPDENGRIQRFMFPELWQQAVRVGNYAYDAVNKALQLGLGVETEIWGLRRTTLDACPELARYIGQVNRLKRLYPHLLIRGAFRDTLGATVRGDVHYSVLEASNGDRALVLRNPHLTARKVIANLARPVPGARHLWYTPTAIRPRPLRRWPLTITLPPRRAAVLLELQP